MILKHIVEMNIKKVAGLSFPKKNLQ